MQSRTWLAVVALVWAFLLVACLSSAPEGSDPEDRRQAATAEPTALDASDPVHSEEEEPEAIDEVAMVAPPLTLVWSELSPGVETELSNAQTTLTITNNSDSDSEVVVELDWIGDLGTTNSYKGELDSVLFDSDSGSQLDVEIDLGSIFPELDTTYSGYLHVAARIVTAEGQHDQVISPGIYFHQDDGTTFIYDEEVLRSEYRGGDFDGLVDASAQLVDEGEDRDIVRIIAYEGTDINDGSLIEGLSDLADDPANTAGSTPVNTSGTLVQAEDPAAHSWNQTLCVNWEAQTVDSGFTNSVGITEDYWSSANSGITTIGYGVRVKIGAATFDTNVNGCVTFTSTGSSYTADVLVYAYVTDSNGSFLRMHNAASNTQDSYPGSTYGVLHINTAFNSGATTTLDVGDYTARWTAMAAMAHSLWFYNDGISNTEYHVSDLAGQNPDVDLDCSANFNYYNDVADNESYIRLVSANIAYCPFHNQQNKFVLSHEYGHAYGFQLAGIGSQSPAATNHSATPAGSCLFAGGYVYDNNTKEWGSIGIREGFAHYISARIWNAAAADGQFKWGSSFDLERWDPSNLPGGYLVNQCCPDSDMACAASLDGAGTITDWMRAFWDMHTDATCTSLTKANMPYLYAFTILQGGLTNDNFFSATQAAMSWWSSTCQDRWDDLACRNGIDREGAIWSGC